MKIYAQHGYGKSDKIHKGLENGSLSGLIISPRDEKIDNIRSFRNDLDESFPQAEILIDPQFYYATYVDSTSKNLNECEYYPGTINLSQLRSPQNLNKYALECLSFQNELGVSKLISPSILIPNFTDRQAQIALTMAEASIAVANQFEKPLLISLVFSESALNETDNVNEFLNELSMLAVDGFYIIVARNNTDYNQRFDDSTSLTNLLTMIYSLSEINEFNVVTGYSDFVGLLYLSVGASGIATGWHNSSRKFTVQQRILPVSGGRLPRERYSSVPLLNSIYTSELDSISKQVISAGGRLEEYLSGTLYDEIILAGGSPSDGWSRQFSHLQHWAAIKQSSNSILAGKDISARLDSMLRKITEAKSLYSILRGAAVQFEKSTSSDHLSTWETGLKQFRALHNI